MADANSIEQNESPQIAGETVQQSEGSMLEEPKARQFLKKIQASVERLIGPPPYTITLGQVATVVTIPVFCWVFFTTWSGMIDIMRRETYDWVGVLGACVGTTAILVMLAATSLSLGADLGALIARRQFLGERIVIKTVVTSTVFLFVFSMSAFFSFTYYYTNIFRLSSKKIVSEMQPMELAADVLLAGSKQINANYDADTARIVSAPGMNAYLESLDALIQLAGGAGANLRDEIRKNQDRLQRAAAEEAKRTAAELQEAHATSRQLDETRNKIAALNQIVVDLEPIIKSKQDEIVSLTSTARQEDQLAIDASKGLDGLGAACGPNCKSHQAKAAAARSRIATIRQTLVAPLNDRANAIAQRDALTAQIVTLRQKAESAASARKQIAPKEEGAFDLDTTLRELTDLRNQIRSDPTWAKVRQAKTSCSLIFVTARQSNMLPPAVRADFECEPSDAAVHDLLTARDALIANRAAFNEKCSLDGAVRESITNITRRIRNASEVDTSAAANVFNDAKQIVDECVVAGKAAGLSELDVQGLLKRSDAFLRSHTMERNRFELAREAFLSLTPDATMAIGIAVAQDAFILVMKLLSEIFRRETKMREGPTLPPAMDMTDSEEDDPDIRVMKVLLRASRPLHGDMSAFDPNAYGVTNLPENVRENLIGLLNRLVREETAYLDGKGVYIIENKTLMEVEARLETALKEAALRAAVNAERAARDGAAAFAEEYRRMRGGGSIWRTRRRSALERYLSPAPALLRPENGDGSSALHSDAGAAAADREGMRESA